ncbi:MAG: Obg family GTPase CgtA [Ruthenibacterium sp.]
MFLPISAATRKGLDVLPGMVYERLQTLPPIITYEPDYVKPDPALKDGRAFAVTHAEDGAWEIEAPWLVRILEGCDINDYESLQYFQRQLADAGVLDRLIALGVQENDTIRIDDFEFDYVF